MRMARAYPAAAALAATSALALLLLLNVSSSTFSRGEEGVVVEVSSAARHLTQTDPQGLYALDAKDIDGEGHQLAQHHGKAYAHAHARQSVDTQVDMPVDTPVDTHFEPSCIEIDGIRVTASTRSYPPRHRHAFCTVVS